MAREYCASFDDDDLPPEGMVRWPSWLRDFGATEVFIDFMLLAVLPICALTSENTSVGVLEPIRWLGLAIFGSRHVLKTVLLLAWVVHCLEALYAGWLTTRLPMSKGQRLAWTGMVLLHGVFSLRRVNTMRHTLEDKEL